MIRNRLILTLLFAVLYTLSYSQTNKNLGIIPAPLSVRATSGEFLFSNQSAIQYETEEDLKIANLFRDFLKDNYSFDIQVAKSFASTPNSVIRFISSGYSGTNSEGYTIQITPQQINVSGPAKGMFYAYQSLIQMLPVAKTANPKIVCAEIADEPRYKYRGLHLDVCRHIFSMEYLKRYIDLLAQYKLNTFHWHLTDDQGWRIEIKKYPKLTEIGGYRAQTVIGNYHDRMPQWFDNTRYGGFYTQEQVKEIVAYAATKFVTVIPEIEMPGHALAALSAYPELGCGDNPGPYLAAEKWGVFEDIFCAGKDQTFSFMEDVLLEVIELFPSQYIHVGGDEAPKTKWKTCKYCQKRIKDHKLKGEHELQSYFVQRIEKFLNSKGKQIIGWDEILEGGLAPNATVMSWRGTEGGIAAAKQNHDVIMSPQTYIYLDHLQGNSLQEPLTIGGFNPLDDVYSYNPTPSSLTPAQQNRIIGVQANLWTEYVETEQKADYMVYPRMMALAEIAWTKPLNKDYADFSQQRLPIHLAKLDKTDVFFRVPTAYGVTDTTLMGGQFTIPLKPSVEGAKIYYTINGYTPGETDHSYNQPINIMVPPGERRYLKTIVITPSGKRSPVTTTILNNEPALPPSATYGQNAGLKYYFVPGIFGQTAEVDTLKATEKGTTAALNITKFRSKARTFGMVFEGYINILQDGIHTFNTTSDDGSRLFIDDKLVVDNDGKHAAFPLTSAVNLLKGYHKIQIRYFQGGGSGELRVYMKAPGASKATEITPGLLSN